MKKLLLPSLLIFIVQSSLFSQNSLSMQLVGFMPQGQLKEDMPDFWGGGMGLEYVHQHNRILSYGTRLTAMLRPKYDSRQLYINPEYGEQEVTWNKEAVTAIGFIRFKPPFKTFRPYVDFAAGRVWVSSYAFFEAEAEDSHPGCPEDETHYLERYRQSSWFHTIGGGLEVSLNEKMMLDFQVMPVRGIQADLLTSDPAASNMKTDKYEMDLRRGRVDLLSFSVTLKMDINFAITD